ncbi:MAG: CCA tRNA nucleotidyltransferase [Bacillota bacterium]
MHGLSFDQIPEGVRQVLRGLADFEAYLVGGCVRDALLGRPPKDWDVVTSARPEEVMDRFDAVIPVGLRFGTVTVLAGDLPVEVTTFRRGGEPVARPQAAAVSPGLLADLSGRDFTVNAMAWSPAAGLVDPFGGRADLERRILRAVGDPVARFREDPLRMLRAIRFAATLGFAIHPDTWAAIRSCAAWIARVAVERVRDELNRILLSDRPAQGMTLLADSGLLRLILPELEACRGFDQRNPHHHRDVFGHTLEVLDQVPAALHLRLAALLHDVGKPHTFTLDEQGVGHFYGHEKKGAELTAAILRRLRYSRELVARVVHLVRHHMVPLQMGPRGRRRWVARVGAEHVEDLLALRWADLGGRVRDDELASLEALRQTLQEMQQAGVANPAAALAVSGRDVMEALGIGPGPQVGKVLRRLREIIAEDPSLNRREVLLSLVREIARGEVAQEEGAQGEMAQGEMARGEAAQG